MVSPPPVEADLGRLAEWPDSLLVLSVNYRMIRMLFEALISSSHTNNTYVYIYIYIV